MNYAKILKELRAEKGLTQVELAKLAHLAPSCIAMIEVGKNEPTAKTLVNLSKALNVSIDYLVGNENDFGVVDNNEFEKLNYQEYKMIKIYRAVSERDKKLVESIFDGLVTSELQKQLNLF